MTKEEAMLIAGQLEKCSGPVRFEFELDDLFLLSIQRGFDWIVVYKDTGKTVWANTLSVEESESIMRRYNEMLRKTGMRNSMEE